MHAVNGIWGTLAVGLFSTGADGVGKGLFYGGGFMQLGIQALGFASVAAYVLTVMFIAFTIIDKTVGLRVPEEVEIEGLDIHEHGLASAYSGFAISDAADMTVDVNENTDLGTDQYSEASEAQKRAAIPVRSVTAPVPTGSNVHNVVIICRLSRFDKLKRALNEQGVTGMTVAQVMGSGIQKGTDERYRGVVVDSTLLPKVKVEVVISKISVDHLIETVKKALYTGHIGDGKIFVYDVQRVVKVRTGEEGYDAVQDVE